jgi:hypothetical protein
MNAIGLTRYLPTTNKTLKNHAYLFFYIFVTKKGYHGSE